MMRDMLRALEQSSLSSTSAFVPSPFLVSESHVRNPPIYLLKADSLSTTLHFRRNNRKQQRNPPIYLLKADSLSTTLHFRRNNRKQQRERCSSSQKLSCRSLQNPLIASPSKPIQMADSSQSESKSFKLLFVEMGVGQDITSAAVKACKNAITSNSIPAFRTGALPGVSWEQMKLKVKLGVPRSAQRGLDIDRVKGVFPYGEIVDVEVVDGGLVCSSGVALEALGDKSDDCYVVNAAVYVGY